MNGNCFIDLQFRCSIGIPFRIGIERSRSPIILIPIDMGRVFFLDISVNSLQLNHVIIMIAFGYIIWINNSRCPFNSDPRVLL